MPAQKLLYLMVGFIPMNVCLLGKSWFFARITGTTLRQLPWTIDRFILWGGYQMLRSKPRSPPHVDELWGIGSAVLLYTFHSEFDRGNCGFIQNSDLAGDSAGDQDAAPIWAPARENLPSPLPIPSQQLIIPISIKIPTNLNQQQMVLRRKTIKSILRVPQK